MKRLSILFLIIVIFPLTAWAEVSRFVFVTPKQTVNVNVISRAITIQSQNNAGLSEAVTETTDLLFQSTSPTGKFVASSGKPASKTMSKNTAKRTFYYIDTTAGTHTLTVKTTGRTSKETFSLSQTIVVGNGNQERFVEVENTPIPVPIKNEPQKKEVVKPVPIQKPIENASSTIEVKETSTLAAVVYTAPPKTSALDSFLWLPKKIWDVVSSVFK